MSGIGCPAYGGGGAGVSGWDGGSVTLADSLQPEVRQEDAEHLTVVAQLNLSLQSAPEADQRPRAGGNRLQRQGEPASALGEEHLGRPIVARERDELNEEAEHT